MSDRVDPKERELVPIPGKELAIRSSALIKRGLDTLASLQGRVVRFPANRSMGSLFIRDRGEDCWIEGQGELGEARGDVSVPSGKDLRLKIGDEGATDLSPLASLHPVDLEELDLRGKEHVDDKGLVHIGELAGLKSLNISETKITDAGLSYLKKQLKLLEGLYLIGTQITDRGLVHIGEFSRLKCLNINGTKITDAGLVHLKTLTELELLALDSTSVTDAGLIHLRELKKLRHASLINTKISGPGLRHLSTLPDLCILLLERTKISDSGIAHVSGLTGLWFLDLSYTSITDGGLVHIEQLPALRFLCIEGNQVSDAAINRLQQALPNCRIRTGQI